MIKVSLLGFTTEIKNQIDQSNFPEGGQKSKKKKILEGKSEHGNYWKTNKEGSYLPNYIARKKSSRRGEIIPSLFTDPLSLLQHALPCAPAPAFFPLAFCGPPSLLHLSWTPLLNLPSQFPFFKHQMEVWNTWETCGFPWVLHLLLEDPEFEIFCVASESIEQLWVGLWELNYEGKAAKSYRLCRYCSKSVVRMGEVMF